MDFGHFFTISSGDPAESTNLRDNLPTKRSVWPRMFWKSKQNAGWPGEFVKKSTQMWPNPYFVKNNTYLYLERKYFFNF
jgi:hypothetical protein